jgi:4-hydroxythreonine-4-phosphate dehydrogenase
LLHIGNQVFLKSRGKSILGSAENCGGECSPFALAILLACQAAKNGNHARNRLSNDPITITSMRTRRKQRIGITLGDCAGIGPEIVDLALKSDRIAGSADYNIIGKYPDCHPGQPTQETARAAAAALEEAVILARRGELDAIVTGPMHKARMYEVGFRFSGQTEFFAERCGIENFAMCLTGGKITVALVTAHLPLRKVASALKQSEIVRVGLLLANFLHSRSITAPRIAVAGLNPHAGESGKLGREEIEIIGPAIAALKSEIQNSKNASPARTEITGPHSPDTVFHRAIEGEFDAVLCMYHDQGLIPVKLYAFHEGVNVTLGLPFPRTSPDHGTAFEIAGKGIARPDSMISAINLAVELAQ